MKPWTLTVEAQNGALKFTVDQWSQICITLVRSRIRIRNPVSLLTTTFQILVHVVCLTLQEHAADTQFPRGEDDRSPGP
jgi:hypothetical protein